MNTSRFAILTVTLILLALTLACEKKGGDGGDLVLTSVSFAVTNDSGANDTINRIMTIAKGDTTNTTVYQFTVVGLDQNGNPMNISGMTISWSIVNSSLFSFVAAGSLNGDDETCEVRALHDYFTNGNNAVASTITVTVNGIGASESYTLEGRINKEGTYDGELNTNPMGGLINLRQNGGTTNYFDWPGAFPAVITDTSIDWTTNDPGAFTGTITSEGAAMSGTHNGFAPQTWSLTPN